MKKHRIDEARPSRAMHSRLLSGPSLADAPSLRRTGLPRNRFKVRVGHGKPWAAISSLFQLRKEDDANQVLEEVHHDGSDQTLSPQVNEGEDQPHGADGYDTGGPLVAVSE